jgi:methylglyoxal synthase
MTLEKRSKEKIQPSPIGIQGLTRRKFGRVALISTPKFREEKDEELLTFINQHLYTLCHDFDVYSTGRTYERALEAIENPSNIPKWMRDEKVASRQADSAWKRLIKQNLKPVGSSIGGMIELAYEMVQGRLDAFVHLTDLDDMNSKADSRTLRRLANVHNVPHANDYLTADVLIHDWRGRIAREGDKPDFNLFETRAERRPVEESLSEEGPVVALIAHDAKKLDMASFVVEHSRKLRNEYRWILATGHTSDLVKRFLRGVGWGPEDEKRVITCLPGPQGGDMEIAAMVIRKRCHKVVFFQDPMQSHPHGPDIALFEQAVLAPTLDAPVPLASNPATAAAIL